MTADEERQYLCDLIMSASEWRLSEGDERDTLRLEIQDRLRRLNGVETEDENGYNQSEPVEVSPVLTQDDFKALEAAKLDEHLASPDKVKNAKERWKHGRVRVTIDGKPVWKLECDCHKEIIPGFEKKWHWVANDRDNKQEQVDAMWAEHERT